MLIVDMLEDITHYSVRLFTKKQEKCPDYLKNWNGNCGKPTFNNVVKKTMLNAPKYHPSSKFWNFRKPSEPLLGVTVYPECIGFNDLRETRSIADLIVLTSNLLDFQV